MKYESIPRKIINACSDIFKYMKEEFGNWAYVLLAILAILLYKPLLILLDLFFKFTIYGVAIIIGLGFLYYILKKIFK